MCGLVGVIRAAGLDVGKDLVTNMAESITHRGPDSHGIWAEHEAILGHRRLAIIDLSASGHQPMASHNGRYMLSYNGELYNHLDLRQRLEQEHRIAWRGHSDTETLLECLAHWGVRTTLERANGMLAFALWDRERKSLVLARDRYGEKPLAYAEIGGGIAFASEIRALRLLPQLSSEPDRESVAAYLNQWYVPAPRTILPGVRKLPAGHYLEWTAQSGASLQCYWSPADALAPGATNPFSSREEAIVTIEALITDAVKIRMMSDVPLGALLSGGIDSSLVCALMQKSQTTKVKTFSIGFDSAEYDESKHAAAVAQHLGTEHECLHLTEAEVLDTVPRIATIYDEPFADGSQIPTYLVSRLTRGHVTVALTGDGFDELFAGYARYVLTQKAWERIRALPLRNQLAGMVAQLPDGVIGLADSLLGRLVPAGVNASSLGKKLKHSGHLLRSKSAEDVFRSYMTAWVDPQELLADGRTDWARPPMAQAVAGDMMARLMLDDQLNYLPDDILCKVDRASMAVSLETRIPALDPRVAEAAWRIPEPERWFGGKGKSILRDILYRHVPQEIVDRPKRGFAVPLEEWLHGPLQGWAGDLLAEDTVRRQGILNASVVSRKWKDYRDGGVTTSAQIWTLLMFQAWMAAR